MKSWNGFSLGVDLTTKEEYEVVSSFFETLVANMEFFQLFHV